METFVNQLSGYLQSLRRLSGNKCDYWAFRIEVESNVVESLLKHFADCGSVQKILEEKAIDYAGVKALLDEYIFSNLLIDDEDNLTLLEWDIVEYYGLASTEESADAEFNPLVSKGAIQLTMCPGFYKSHVYYVVPISNYAIVTGLAIRA